MRLSIKFLISNNLTKIIDLRDDKGVCPEELELKENYNNYREIINNLNRDKYDMNEQIDIYNRLVKDNIYLRGLYNKINK